MPLFVPLLAYSSIPVNSRQRHPGVPTIHVEYVDDLNTVGVGAALASWGS